MYFVEGEPAIHPIDKPYELKLWIIAIVLLVLGVFPALLFNYISI
jgi:hypothetical protein